MSIPQSKVTLKEYEHYQEISEDRLKYLIHFVKQSCKSDSSNNHSTRNDSKTNCVFHLLINV